MFEACDMWIVSAKLSFESSCNWFDLLKNSVICYKIIKWLVHFDFWFVNNIDMSQDLQLLIDNYLCLLIDNYLCLLIDVYHGPLIDIHLCDSWHKVIIFWRNDFNCTNGTNDSFLVRCDCRILCSILRLVDDLATYQVMVDLLH